MQKIKTTTQLFPEILVICYLENFGHTVACLAKPYKNDMINSQLSGVWLQAYNQDYHSTLSRDIVNCLFQATSGMLRHTWTHTHTPNKNDIIDIIYLQLLLMFTCMHAKNNHSTSSRDTGKLLFPSTLGIPRLAWSYPNNMTWPLFSFHGCLVACKNLAQSINSFLRYWNLINPVV